MSGLSEIGIGEIFLVMLLSSLLSLGGGNGPLAVIQDVWVKPGTLQPGLFTWAVAISNLTPGPRAGFLAGIGYYLHGFPGAAAAVIGIVIPTCIGAAGVTYGLNLLQPIIRRASLPAGFVVAGMIAAAAWQTARPMHFNLWDMAGVAVVAFLVIWRDISPVWIVLSAAAVGLLWRLVQLSGLD